MGLLDLTKSAAKSGASLVSNNKGKVATLGASGLATAAAVNQTTGGSDTVNTKEVETGPSTSSSSSAGSMPPIPKNEISQENAANLVKRFLSGNGEINCLNSFFQTAYHFRLFMTNDKDPYVEALKAGPVTPKAVYDQVAKLPQITIAETGVTTYNIRSVQIESVVSANPTTRSINTTRMTLVVTEPMGVGFVDSIKLASEKLKIKNYDKCPYYLELTFKAYDEAGNIALGDKSPVAALKLDGKDRWIWQIQITDIDVHLDAAGGTYTVQCIQYNDVGWDNDIKTVPETISVSGGTLGETFENLGRALSDSWKVRMGNDVVKYGGVVEGVGAVPAFKWHPMSHAFGTNVPGDVPNDVSQWRTTRNLDLTSMRAYSMSTGNPMAQFQTGMTIDKMLEAAIVSSPEAEKMMKRDVPAGIPRENIVFRVETDVFITGYEWFSQQYYRVICFHVYPFYTLAPVSDMQQPINASTAQVAGLSIQKLIEKGFAKKHYDYIYTGLNTEVTDFDIRYNLKWAALLPRLHGMNSRLEQIEVPAVMVNHPGDGKVVVDVKKETLDYNATNETLQAVNSDVSTLRNYQTAVANATTQTEKDESTKRLDAFKSELQSRRSTSDLTALGTMQQGLANSAADKSSRINAAKSFAVGETDVASGATTYAEVLIDQQMNGESATILPIAFSQCYKEATDATGTGVSGAGKERTVFGAVVDQLYESDLKQFVVISLGIRGDPYWLGQTNLAHQVYVRNGQTEYNVKSDEPDWTRGDYPFLLKFRYPKQVDGDFVPQFRDDEVFSGFYRPNKITNLFSDGMFKQTINAIRIPLIDIVKAKGYTGIIQPSASTPVTAARTGKAMTTGSSTNPNTGLVNPDMGDGTTNKASSYQVSSTAVDFVKARESLRTDAYNDGGSHGGTMTIGYGHIGDVDGVPITPGMTITEDKANELLRQDLQVAGNAVGRQVTAPITQNQYDALASFTMNLGSGNLSKSSILKDVNSGNTDSVGSDLGMWNQMNGSPAAGLTKRRTAEANMFNGLPFQLGN